MAKGLLTRIKPRLCLLSPRAAPSPGSRLRSDPVFRRPGGISLLFEASEKLQVRESGGVMIVLFIIRSFRGKKTKRHVWRGERTGQKGD